MSGEDKSEDIDITNVDESEETLESQYFPYDPGFEDITDDEGDCLKEAFFSPYPMNQSSRTSPGNHATIRRWKQRLTSKHNQHFKNKLEYFSSEVKSIHNIENLSTSKVITTSASLATSSIHDHHTPHHNSLHHETILHNSPQHEAPLRETPPNKTPHLTSHHVTPHHVTPHHETSHHDTPPNKTPHRLTPRHETPHLVTPHHEKRSQSVIGWSTLSVDTTTNSDHIGPLSAPCIAPSISSPLSVPFISSPQSLPCISSSLSAPCISSPLSVPCISSPLSVPYISSPLSAPYTSSPLPVPCISSPLPSTHCTSTPVNPNNKRFPFHISSILGSPSDNQEKNKQERMPAQADINKAEGKSDNQNDKEATLMPNSLDQPSVTNINPYHPSNTDLSSHHFPYYSSDYFLRLQQQLLLLYSHKNSTNSLHKDAPKIPTILEANPSISADMPVDVASAIETNTSHEDDKRRTTRDSISFTDSGLHISSESSSQDTSSLVGQTQTEEDEDEDIIIDVEHCEDDFNIDALTEYQSISTGSNDQQDDIQDTIYENNNESSHLEVSNFNQQSDQGHCIKEYPKSTHNYENTNECKGNSENYYNPKKKIFAHWSKYGDPVINGTEALKSIQNIPQKQNPHAKNINLDEIHQYRHKKIRRESSDIIKSDNRIIGDQKDSNHGEQKSEKITMVKVRKVQNWPKKCVDSKYSTNKQKTKSKTDVKEWETKEIKTNYSKSLQQNLPNQTPSCTLKESDLIDGLRILAKFGSHFYPGRLTEISAPDVYGIIIDKERGGKPHIFSREEIIRDMILEMRPRTVTELELGARVCAYWSTKINYLHPGTVAGPDIDSDYVIIQLDDGDCRDIHIDQVRYLPTNYPILDVTVENSVGELYGSRKRLIGAKKDGEKPEKEKGLRAKRSLKTKQDHQKQKCKRKSNDWTVVVTEVIDSVETANTNANYINDDMNVRDEDQDSAFESDEEIDDKEYYKVNQPSLQTKSAIAAFLPPQHLWSWSDEGRKLSPKSRKVYHDIIEKDDEKIKVGDCVVFLSTGRPDRPYIGRIDSMWQNTTGNMRVQVMWFYHPAEVEGTAVGGGRVEDIRRKGALFSSNHYDENDVQTISHKCQVLQLQEFTTANIVDSDSDDTYYVAGQYDPVEGVIVFIQGLWE